MTGQSPRSRKRHLGLLLLLAIVVVACGASPGSSSGSAAGSASTEPSSSPTVTSPSPAETVTPQPTGTPLPPCDPGVICEGTLAAGTYSTGGMGLTVGFTLTGTGWIGGGDRYLDGFRLSNREVGGENTIAVTTWNGQFRKTACDPTNSDVIELTVSAFMARLAATRGVTAGTPASTTVAGWQAQQLGMTVVSPCPNAAPLVLWLSDGGTPYTIVSGQRALVFAFRVDLPRSGGLIPLVKYLVVVVEGSGDVDFDLLLLKADDVLTTMTIGL